MTDPQPLNYATRRHQAIAGGRLRGWVVEGLKMFGTFVLALVFVLGTAAVFAALGSAVASYIGLGLALLVLISWARWREAARTRRAMTLLAPLRLAVTLNLPLPAILSGAEQAETGRTRRQLQQLRLGIEAGGSIGPTLRHVAPELPPDTVNQIIAAEHNGVLPAVMARLDARTRHRTGDPAAASIQFNYAFIAFAIMLGMVALLMVFVMPKFEAIFRDFKVNLPWEAVMLLNFSRNGWPVMIAVLCLLPIWLIVLSTRSVRSIFLAPSQSGSIFHGLSDRVRWILPVSHALQRDRGLADALETFADGLEAGRPAHDALRVGVQPHLNRVLTKKLSHWADQLQTGRLIHDAAAGAGLPKLLSAMLIPGSIGTDPVPALRFLARYYRDRTERLVLLLQAALSPLTTLLLGGAVLLVTLAIFRSIQVLIASIDTGFLP